MHIALILVVVFGLSYCVNTFFMPHYFVHQKRASQAEAVEKLRGIKTSKHLFEEAQQIADDHRLTIVQAPYDRDIERLNGALREQFARERIVMSKFWLTEDSLVQLMHGEKVTISYRQAKLKTSVIVTFLKKEGIIFAAGESVANSEDTIRFVNQFHMFIAIGVLLLALMLAAWFSKRMVRPLEQLKNTAEDIAELTFRTVDIRTGDEIEELAHSINTMSDRLELAHQELEEKNRNLHVLIRDISHELKTPLAVMKAYSSGLKDGMDDGTFVDVIQKQADDMSNLVTKLLEWSRLQAEELSIEPVNIKKLLDQVVGKFDLSLQQQSIVLSIDDKKIGNCCVTADKLKLEMVLNNLVSNAVKYTTNGTIKVRLKSNADDLTFCIRNGCSPLDDAQLRQLWEPFFVLESSRSKQFSGTGLGLSIAKGILQKHQAVFGVSMQGNIIEFHFTLPLCPVGMESALFFN